MHLVLAALLFATPPEVARSVRLTAAAEQLLEVEKKMVTSAQDRVGDLLFADVLSLLDAAVTSNPANLHARAIRAQVLLLRSYDGEAEYDVCYVVDARTDAEFVVSRAARAAPADVKIAREVLRGIDLIPADAIPDPPSVCEEDDERGTPTKIR
jgi:hypothetical protein